MKAAPITKAYFEEGKKHPDKATFDVAFMNRVAEIKKKSVLERKAGSLEYRSTLEWAGLDNQADFDTARANALKSYYNGTFFMERLGRYKSVDLELTAVVLGLREQWIKEYQLATVPEFMILDLAMTSYFHFLRLNEAVNNIMASIEWEYFALDAPPFVRDHRADEKDNRLLAEQLAHRLQEVLEPTLDRYNRSFIRNLKALRDLRRSNVMLNIGRVEQVNFGSGQINEGKNTKDSG
jgi:hypothetical protein